MDNTVLEQISAYLALYWPVGVALLSGVVAASVLWQMRLQRRVHEAFEAGLTRDAEQTAAQKRLAEERFDVRMREMTRLEGRFDALEQELQQAKIALESRSQQVADYRANQAALEVRLEETAKAFAEKEALFKDSSTALKQEFELLANKIFEHQGQRQQEKLTSVLSPFREQIVDFRKRVEEVYHTESKDRASLLSEVKNLQAASEKINQEAENLTKALKGDVKVQGNWGEMVLERVLEESGLRAGFEYFAQPSHRSEDGDLKRPDVLIRLPEDKDVVIDAKVSLLGYEQALSAETEEARETGIKQHLVSMRGHVKRLSEQDYDQLSDVRSLDFVLLFVPIESAFTMAMEHDPRLFTEAFEKRIVIVSPTTLMMTLRIIHNVWRFEKQNRNAQEIARKAGALYDKLRGLIEDMDKLGQQLGTVDKTFKSAYGKIASGKGNLVRQVEHFRELGAQIKKPLPKNLLEEADSEEG